MPKSSTILMMTNPPISLQTVLHFIVTVFSHLSFQLQDATNAARGGLKAHE